MVSAAANTLQHAAHPVSRQGGACSLQSCFRHTDPPTMTTETREVIFLELELVLQEEVGRWGLSESQ